MSTTTNIIFKRKCKSVPHLRKKLYSKISNNSLKERWKVFLENEQQLNPILVQLSRAQFDIRSHDKFKYTARSILMMKREIIRCIQQKQLEKGNIKLRQLYEKVNSNEMRKIGMMIIFLECREQLNKGLGNGKEETIICWLKDKLAQHLNINEMSLIKIKLLTILSILLLRFHGILMSTEEKTIIFKTIQLKKAKMLQIDIRQQRQTQFECLVYLLLQLYKILYLLKRDQQTIHFYYNQLHAYTQIYLTRQENKLYLDINELNKILTNMRPILNELDIYEDSKIRKDLAFAHIQQEIIQQESQSSKLLEQRRAREKSRIQSSIKISTPKQPRKINIRNNQKLVINHFITKNQDCFKQQKIQDVLTIQRHPMHFSFLICCQQRLYIAQVIFSFRNGCNLVDLILTIKNRMTLLQIFRIYGIQVCVAKLSFKAFSRFLQKLCEYIFKANLYFREINNLYFADDFIPKGLDIQNIVIAMARIKAQIGEYIKQNIYRHSITGYKFTIPKITLHDLKYFFDSENKVNEPKSQKMMISRREGFILKENFKREVSNLISIKVLLKKQYEQIHQYYFFNIFFDFSFKGIQIYYLKDRQQTVDLTDFISKLKKISLKLFIEKRSVRKLHIIQDMLALQNKIERVAPRLGQFKVDEELQINQQKWKYEQIPIEYAKPKQKPKQKAIKPKLIELIKMDNMKYYLFVKQIRNNFMIFKNDKAKLYLPLNWRQSLLTLVKSRLRLYSGIKIVRYNQSLNYFIRSYRQDQNLAIKEQLIVLKFQGHKVIRKRSGYSMLLQYKTDSNEYLYEIVHNMHQRFYYLSAQKIKQWPRRLTMEAVSQKYPFKLYQGIREKISEANWYYINVLKCKSQE